MIIKKRIIKEKVVESKLGKSSYKEQNYQYDEYGNIKSYYNEFNTLIKEDSYNKQGLLLKEKYYDGNEKELNRGFSFVIKYKDEYIERIKYKFYRISIIEENQFRRLKKKINSIRFN